MMTLSKYTRQYDHCEPTRTKSTRCWKVTGAFNCPKGMTLTSKRCTMLSYVDLRLTFTCLYPLVKSRVLNQCKPTRVGIKCIVDARESYR